jgi:hypothetical protein
MFVDEKSKLKLMKLHLHNRLYHFIWTIWPKSRITIEGLKITYICLPRFLLMGGFDSKTFFVSGMTITHQPSKTVMIFISREKLKHHRERYTLYHEHIEGTFFLIAKQKGQEALRAWLKPIIVPAENSLRTETEFLKRIVKYLNDSKEYAHACALMAEMALAKKEMPPGEFSEFIKEALEDRL